MEEYYREKYTQKKAQFKVKSRFLSVFFFKLYSWFSYLSAKKLKIIYYDFFNWRVQENLVVNYINNYVDFEKSTLKLSYLHWVRASLRCQMFASRTSNFRRAAISPYFIDRNSPLNEIVPLVLN